MHLSDQRTRPARRQPVRALQTPQGREEEGPQQTAD